MKDTDQILREGKRLFKLGGAVHWLLPKSKRPVESGWTTGSRQSWEELKASYRPGYNIGIRTGEASLIQGRGYLSCIDLDVKDPSYLKEALAKVQDLTGGEVCPEVRSGSGHGSRHLYGLTREPFKMLTIDKQKDRGEICIYSSGRQMVLPPSIHPNGKPYHWQVDPEAFEFPLLDFSQFMEEEKKPSSGKTRSALGVVKEDVEFELDETLDIRWLPDVSDVTRNLIVKGLWQGKIIEDRSAYLLPATHGLLSAGLDRNSILTLLTDPDTYLGECSYEHAQTKSRKRAMTWLWNYTVKRVVEERDPKTAFMGKAVEGAELEGEALLAQDEELRDKPENRGFYTKGAKGGLKPEYGALLREFERTHPYKTIADMKAVFTFNGTHYVDCTPIEIKAFAENKFRPEPEDKLRCEFHHKVLANQVARRSFFTESTEGCVNFQNGVVNLGASSTELLPHSPAFGFRGVLPFEYDPAAQCPVFKEWLAGVMMDDVSLMKILQEFMGYIVRGGDYKYHKALWLGGVGRNGKSTFIDVLKALIGAGNFSVISIKSLMGDKFAGADLDGKIANFSEETSPQELADSGPFKNLTGDGDIFAQKKFGDPYTFRNRAKLIMTYNRIPDLKDLSPGMLSRPLIIPFQKIIKEEEQDREIKQALFKELSGIFNFAVRGWNRLEKQGGFTYSQKSEIALQKIKEESCNVYQWVENRIEANSDNPNDPHKELYKPITLYEIYTKHEKFPFKAVEFYRRLNSHPLIQKKHTKEGNFYYGFSIR